LEGKKNILFVCSSIKRFIFCSLLFISSTPFYSQDPPEGVFSLKPSAGLNACQVHGDSYSGFNKAGVFAGFAVNARLTKRASLEMGFYYSQKGARHKQNPEKGDYSYYFVNLNYVDVPLTFHYFLNKDYFFTAGPSLALLISYKEIVNGSDYSGVYPFSLTEVGINVGLGKKIKEKFYVEVRSSNSISPIRSYGVLATKVFYPNPIAQAFNKGLYNNIITFILSYKFNIKKKKSEQDQ
jgi:hypothetical protein